MPVTTKQLAEHLDPFLRIDVEVAGEQKEIASILPGHLPACKLRLGEGVPSRQKVVFETGYHNPRQGVG